MITPTRILCRGQNQARRERKQLKTKTAKISIKKTKENQKKQRAQTNEASKTNKNKENFCNFKGAQTDWEHVITHHHASSHMNHSNALHYCLSDWVISRVLMGWFKIVNKKCQKKGIDHWWNDGFIRFPSSRTNY